MSEEKRPSLKKIKELVEKRLGTINLISTPRTRRGDEDFFDFLTRCCLENQLREMRRIEEITQTDACKEFIEIVKEELSQGFGIPKEELFGPRQITTDQVDEWREQRRRTRLVAFDVVNPPRNDPRITMEESKELDDKYPHYCQNKEKERHDIYFTDVLDNYIDAIYHDECDKRFEKTCKHLNNDEKNELYNSIQAKYIPIFKEYWKNGILQFYCCNCFYSTNK